MNNDNPNFTSLSPNGTDTSRRKLLKSGLLISAGSLLGSLSLPGLANSVVSGTDPLAAFIKVTQLITEHRQIDASLAAHFFQVFAKADRQFSARLHQLLSAASATTRASQLMDIARNMGLQDFLQSIITAWYTGTVGNDYHGTLVSYKHALMYSTVSDGLIVPTYCGNGPLWWTAPVPDADNNQLIDSL